MTADAAGVAMGTRISIHTFLTEGDKKDMTCRGFQYISIHTFLTEGDLPALSKASDELLFQSTPSLRKVTTIKLITSGSIQISIHTFLTEGDST